MVGENDTITAPSEIVSALRRAEGSQVSVVLSDSISVRGEEYESAKFLIERVEQESVDVVGTTADQQLIAEGVVTEPASNGEIERWRVTVKRFNCEWSKPQISGWFWNGSRYESTISVGVVAVEVTAAESVEPDRTGVES